ncbi:leukocyte-specific transcript 1 protein isoform X1 [Alligator sinensis]|uniref:Leukocyte-specific transcript 1 protein isoform X1 n=1 Tax=Alligator sinensis TaxID=38654 RepID=A0A1U8DUP6_ALLSI|nr:leukocyte-specific transcript 1 protein isoform X1 [Alligator sinensis]
MGALVCKNSTCNAGLCTPWWALAGVGAGGFIVLVIIVALSVCLCRAKRRVRKLAALKGGAREEQPDVHYASLQNLGSASAKDAGPEPPQPHNHDYATVAELRRGQEEAGGREAGVEAGPCPGTGEREEEREEGDPPEEVSQGCDGSGELEGAGQRGEP